MSTATIKPTQQFDWSGELNRTVTQSLVATFGLDFLLFEDKKGGDVDTIHNVRQGIYATETAKKEYDNRGDYNSHAYHSNQNYIKRGKRDKKQQEAGQLHDACRNQTFSDSEKGKRQLDHIISAHEIHHDAGRVLAGLDGVELANQESNLQSTFWAINNAKRQHSVENFLEKELPKRLENRKHAMEKRQEKLKNTPNETPKQKHERQVLEKKIAADKEYISGLESIDKEAILRIDKSARQNYNQQVGMAYYSSSKFFKNTANAAALQGVKMGARQAVGLVLAEIWFELKDALPKLCKKHIQSFNFQSFWQDIVQALENIGNRVKERFKEVVTSFKDSFIGGILSSVTTTILNIFFTTGKMLGRFIRESFTNFVQVLKLIFFNPENLSFGDLMREVARLILVSVSTMVGLTLNQYLSKVLIFPFGTEIAAFLSALLTGLMIIGCGYYLDYSPAMQNVWNYLNSLKDRYDVFLKDMQEANAQLDVYIQALAKQEFNLDIQELSMLTYDLSLSTDEIVKMHVLKQHIDNKGIELPFEMGNSESAMSWLNGLAPKK